MGRTLLVTALTSALLLAGCDAIHRMPVGEDSVRTVEVAVFEGGHGIAWYEKTARKYNDLHEADGVRVELWGDPRVAEKIKPRLLRGDPPEVFLVGGLPVWLLIGAGKFYPFDSALDAPGYRVDVPWRDQFVAGTLDTYTSDGHVYAVPSSFSAWAGWYDAKQFRERGWKTPRTWRELDALCREMRAAGVAPLAFQGKYPQYAWATFVTLVQRCGGMAAVNRINALEPSAFSHPDAIWAARLVQDMALRHFQKGAMAMTHTESQLQFVNNAAAVIWCGIWLENEMRSSTPPDFELRCFNVPGVTGGKGNPKVVCGQGGAYLFVPADARNPELAVDFCRYMVSLENAPDMVASIGVVSSLERGTPRNLASPALRSVLDMMSEAPGVFSCRVTDLLLEWTTQVLNPNLAALLRGEISPEAFCGVLDQGVADALRDPNLIIPPYVPFDPALFGEAS